jgi:hypothetical protein
LSWELELNKASQVILWILYWKMILMHIRIISLYVIYATLSGIVADYVKSSKVYPINKQYLYITKANKWIATNKQYYYISKSQ